MAKPTKRILTFKKAENDVTFWIDVATSQTERDKLIALIYETLSMYEIDSVVTKKNLSTYIVVGLGLISYYEDVCNDVLDAYTEWYMHRRTTI